jgi:hypothetical protein
MPVLCLQRLLASLPAGSQFRWRLARQTTAPASLAFMPQGRGSTSRVQPAAQSAIADGESCPAAVNAQTARASTNSSGCQRPLGLRGPGTRPSHSRTHGREEPSRLRTADRSSREACQERQERGHGTFRRDGRVVPPIPREPYPHVKTLTSRHNRQSPTPAPLTHHQGMSLNLAGAVPVRRRGKAVGKRIRDRDAHTNSRR